MNKVNTMTSCVLKRYKPTSPGMRGRVLIDKSSLWKGDPFKPLTKRISASGGRNNQGRITVRHRVSPNRQIYRVISFKRKDLDGVKSVVERIEYDPNRTANIALLSYFKNGKKCFCYIVAPKGLKTGDVILTSFNEKIEQNIGNCMKIKYIEQGSMIHCIELKIGKGACIARSAGCFAKLVRHDDKGGAVIKMSSGESKLVSQECTACIGEVSNDGHANISLGKAGARYYRGFRPGVRGIAMNPVDHHNGGRANGGCIFASPNGRCEKGKKTRKNKRTAYTIVKKRSIK